ncbi:hypothetical protein PoB_001067600 [Plakobranchus ocellatus]|uniref:Uncharacterized protein n=1 Tax=Plakobranchus ocellatus TaxID=259542 RepID=A0AAV3YA84_9GAST|nr:hypothetical protein PoB_001067600 [Plakobranchus ocellatus]
MTADGRVASSGKRRGTLAANKDGGLGDSRRERSRRVCTRLEQKQSPKSHGKGETGIANEMVTVAALVGIGVMSLTATTTHVHLHSY